MISLSNFTRHVNSKSCLNYNAPKKIRGIDYDPNIGYADGTRSAWNKGKTKESCESLKKASDKMKMKYKNGELRLTGCCTSEYFGSDKHIESSRKGGGFRENAGRGVKTHFKNLNDEEFLLRSSFELKVANWLNVHGILWIQPKSIKYYLNNEERRYFPDFYLPAFNIYIETKNDYLMSLQIDKMNAVKDVLGNDNVIILCNNELENLNESLQFLVGSPNGEGLG
jgi:hypothetical protein